MEDQREKTADQACAVPFRINLGRPEFCLISRGNDGRWDFPKCLVADGSSQFSELRRVLEQAGLLCEVECTDPLDEFSASKVDQADQITAFLVRVENEVEVNPESQIHRRRWCFPEEAKVRIRRKPVRHLIDLAVRQLNGGPTR